MSKGFSGLFNNTKGNPAAGSLNLMNEKDLFLINIKHSKDLDACGRLDIIAHGAINAIEINLNGKNYTINHRTLSKMIKINKFTKSIRLLSCDTGSSANGFAQNLANKLNIVVEAPNKILWAYPNGHYIVASRDPKQPYKPNLNDLGKFIKFYPRGTKNGRKQM